PADQAVRKRPPGCRRAARTRPRGPAARAGGRPVDGGARLSPAAKSAAAKSAEAHETAAANTDITDTDATNSEATGTGAKGAAAQNGAADAPPAEGLVSIVGMGPGDPGPLSRRAATGLERADPVAVARARRPGEEIVDEAEGDPVRLAVRAAKDGRRVVRLMSGAPGTGGGLAAEGAALAKAGVPFEVVPGVSSVTGVPGYAGIPLTDAKNREIRIVDASDGDVDWERFAAPDTTLVITGAENAVAEVCKSLIAA